MSNPLEGLERGYIKDGKVFPTLAAVEEYIRGPQVKEALKKLVNDTDSENWIYDNREDIVGAFNINNSRHFLKTEKAQLRKALDAVVTLGGAEFEDEGMSKIQKDMTFILENHDQIQATFKWPAIKKLKDEELAVAVSETLGKIEGSSADLTKWITDSIEDIKVALDTGKIKREVSQKATDGLNAYRLKKALEKQESGVDLTDFETKIIAESQAA